MADLVHLSNSASSEEIIDILNKDAGVIIDNLLHLDDISRINQDLKPYLKNDVFGRDEFTGFMYSHWENGSLWSLRFFNYCRQRRLG